MTTDGRVQSWLHSALADAGRRDLEELKPLLEALAEATETLRRADWNDGAEGTPADPRDDRGPARGGAEPGRR